MRRDIESLLAHEPAASGFLAAPALELEAQGMAEEPGAVSDGTTSRSVHDSRAARSGRHGRGLSRPRPRLGRDVAIKVLPHVFTADPDRLARFEREARMLAALNHPNIGAIYGLEELRRHARACPRARRRRHAGRADRHRRAAGSLTALTIARADCRGARGGARERHLHRDLKPANIKITPDGIVKVLDFGLAKAMVAEARERRPDADDRRPATRAKACILGTAAYMSPEQARGQAVDKRTDIWAFGCVLYEMLTGRSAFAGDTLRTPSPESSNASPTGTRCPSDTPPSVRRLLRRCLEKDPKRRLHDIADARIEIDDALTNPSDSSRVSPTAHPISPAAGDVSVVAWVIATACLAGLVAGWALNRAGSGDLAPPDVRTYSASIVLPAGVRLWSGNPPGRFVLSPDGRRLALVASDSTGRSMLWVRPLDIASRMR